MPTREELKEKPVNPRYEAMKSIVQNRLNENTESGESLREVLEAQGVEMADPDAEIIADTKDSDTHVHVNQEHTVDIEGDSFTPDESAAAAEEETPPDTDQKASEPAGEKAPDKPEVKAKEQEKEQAPDEPVYRKEDGKYYTKIKVNGEEQEVDLDSLRVSAQKDNASRQRFEAAAQKEQEIRKREADLAAKEALAITQNPPTAAEPKAAPAKDVGATVNELYDALAYEDEETVKAKLAEALGTAPTHGAPEQGRGESTTQQPTDIQAEIRAEYERIEQEKWEASRKAAVAQWEIEYEDIAADPRLRQIANMRTAELVEDNPEMFLDDVLQQAGDFARQWHKLQQPPAEATPDPDLTKERKDRKRSAPAPVRTNSSAASRKVENDDPPTRSEIVAGIRAARGQAQP